MLSNDLLEPQQLFLFIQNNYFILTKTLKNILEWGLNLRLTQVVVPKLTCYQLSCPAWILSLFFIYFSCSFILVSVFQISSILFLFSVNHWTIHSSLIINFKIFVKNRICYNFPFFYLFYSFFLSLWNTLL